MVSEDMVTEETQDNGEDSAEVNIQGDTGAAEATGHNVDTVEEEEDRE